MRGDGSVPSGTCRVSLGLRTSDPRNPSVSQRLDAVALEVAPNDRGFFQLVGVPPAMYVITATEPGFAPATVYPVEAGEGLQALLKEPLVLHRPSQLTLFVDPPVGPQGGSWRVKLFHRDATGRSGREYAGSVAADGSWVATHLTPGSYQVFVEDDLEIFSRDRVSRWYNDEIAVEPGDNLHHVDLEVIEVEGSIHLGEDPVRAGIWFGGKSGATRFRFDSDSEGAFGGYLSRDGTWPVEVQLADGLRVSLEPVEVPRPDPGEAASIDLHIPDTAVSGRVVDEDGEPVAGAVVSAIDHSGPSAQQPSRTSSDANGAFQFLGISEGPFLLEASDFSRKSDPVPIHVVEDVPTDPITLVIRSSRRVRGRVFDERGPVPGAVVQVLPLGSAGSNLARVSQAVADPAGRFELELPAGISRVAGIVLRPGYATRLFQVNVSADETLALLVDRSGGTVAISTASRSQMNDAVLEFEGAGFPLTVLVRVASHEVELGDDQLVLRNLAAGDYRLCVGGMLALITGLTSPGTACGTAHLAPFGHVQLDWPERDEQ